MLAEVRIRSEFNYWLTDESCRERFRERLISPIAHLPWTERPVEYKLLRAWHAPATDVENWLQYTLVSCIRFKPIVLMNSNSRTSQCSVKHFLNPAKSHRIQWDPVVECVVAIRRDSLLFCMSRILSDLRIWVDIFVAHGVEEQIIPTAQIGLLSVEIPLWWVIVALNTWAAIFISSKSFCLPAQLSNLNRFATESVRLYVLVFEFSYSMSSYHARDYTDPWLFIMYCYKSYKSQYIPLNLSPSILHLLSNPIDQ